ncbi:NAD-dependent epimerase/dehydratase family protein [Saccharopolyspora rhizosphaerae]|uniref:NAD-dependent epimerase/dehydratase family protein n=1 Tax=Saccharopolyspora rhizosphaerae TaxID=2492662 RepID=A0A426K4Z0_9PSEU|nr:NAD(P)H-binding protein [Saccharopolyspora rhizosphaerae]RRO20463.1 NAD-dependent epimerase/dehydratase family protein [Saccharopolyspora rhizosphaerae]
MDTVAITGGTGHVGRHLVRSLKPTHRTRVLTRHPGTDAEVQWVAGDLATGEGVEELVTGARTVVHAATWSPMAQRGLPHPADFWRSPPDVDVDGTSRLLEASAAAGVEHFTYVSIVGVDRPALPYLRLKHTAEELVSVAEVPWSIVRATQFHWLLDRMFGRAARLPVLPLPASLPTQPVDEADFAAYLATCVTEGPAGRRPDFGGPEVLTLGEAVQTWQEVRGGRARVITVPAPKRLRRIASDWTCPHDRHGRRTWAEWLRDHPAQ